VTVSGPIVTKGGLYHFVVRIETVDADSTLLPDNQEPIYDSWLSIGIAVNHQIDFNGKRIPIKIISYYDKLNNVTFHPSNRSFAWSMPFNWNLTRIKQQPIFVHEEIRLPKSWKGYGDSPLFNATVNGQPLANTSIALDPFSVPNEIVVHYLITKNDLLHFVKKVNSDDHNLMKFTLSPVSTTDQIANSSNTGNNTGGSTHKLSSSQ